MAAAAIDREQLRPSIVLRSSRTNFGGLKRDLVQKSADLLPTPPARARLMCHHSKNIPQKDDADMDEGIGEIENLSLKEELGRGRFGVVFKEATFSKVKVAVKVFRQVVAEEKPKLYKTLSAECDHLRKLDHPNIVQFYGVYYHDQQQLPVMVMELMDKSLTTFVEKSNIGTNTKLSILHDVATGLDFLHSVPVVHGDLSPNNVLLKFIGNDGTLPIAKIADLGLAKFKCQYSNKPQSVDFLAPEALVQKPKYDTPIDVFAFGCTTLYTINEGWPTPEKELTTKFSQYERHQKYLDMMKAKVPELTSMVEACLSNDPERRPSAAVIQDFIELELVQLNNAERTNIDALLSQAEDLVTHSQHDELSAPQDDHSSKKTVPPPVAPRPKQSGHRFAPTESVKKQVLSAPQDDHSSKKTVPLPVAPRPKQNGRRVAPTESVKKQVAKANHPLLLSSNLQNKDGTYTYAQELHEQNRLKAEASKPCTRRPDPNLRDVLQNLNSDVTLTIQLPYLLPILRKQRLVTKTEFQQLSSNRRESDLEKNRKLMKIIVGKGEEAFDLFVEALQEEQEHLGHSSLAKRLLDEQNRLKAEALKSCRPELLPHSKKPATITTTFPVDRDQPQQDVNATKYILSVQGHNDLQNPPLIMAVEKLMKQLNGRLSAVERDVKSIKDAVNNVSLEEKLERAIESIENKLGKLSDFIYSQTEPVYYASMEAKANSPLLLSSNLQNKDETYVYAAGSNEYMYETIAETSVKINNYEYVEEEKLAHGKSGEIWLTVHKKDGSKVVIKKPITKEIFIQEQSAVTNVSHLNIIQLIDSSITKSPVLIFEYAGKGNLLNCLKFSPSSFNPLKLLAISAGVACGMSELEKRAIIHCDVMAKSVLIDSHFVCKITSFSKARCLKPGESNYIPPSNITVLPIKWAAPEILSERKFSIKSDVWAFGVLLSEVFSQGNTPYPNMDNAKVKGNVQNGIKMAQPSDCPDGVYEVMKGCFEFHAENRPSFAVVHQQLMELHSKNPNSSGSECEDL